MCFSSGMGGMEHDAVKLARRQCKNADIVLFYKKGSFIEQISQQYSNDFSCEAVGFSSRTFSVAMLFKVRRLLRKYAIENVIFFGASELKTLHFAFLGFDLNVIVRHGTTKSKSKNDWFHRLVYSQVNYHVALSKHLLNNVRQIVPETKNVKYKIIYPSFEFSDETIRSESDSDQLVITQVARIAAGKGQLDALLACRRLADENIDFRLELLGNVDDKKIVQDLEQVIERSRLSSRIVIHGHVANINDMLTTSDIFLFPSYGEGMANAFIEALYFGLPCLAYNNTVFPEFLEMGFSLTLAKDRDIEDLAAKLLHMARNIKTEKISARNNISLAREYFNIEREKASWLEVLR
jgi:glycosyltransferase involved in cell wall biosynthesis